MVSHYENPEFHSVVLSLLWKPVAALPASLRSRETLPLGKANANVEKRRKRRKRGGKNPNKKSPKPDIFVQ